MDDDVLMGLAAQGDARAFGRLVERHDAAVVAFAWRLLGDRAAAEDAAQEAWLALWRARERYRACGQLRAYLLKLARGKCIDRLRAERRPEPLNEALSAASDPVADARGSALSDALACAVASLPEPQRLVFVLSVDEGLTYAEIAEALGCPLGTVASRKLQAVETLRRKLSDWRDGGDG